MYDLKSSQPRELIALLYAVWLMTLTPSGRLSAGAAYPRYLEEFSGLITLRDRKRDVLHVLAQEEQTQFSIGKLCLSPSSLPSSV